jgi:UDP-3-O-[3-hydroxymyristoyl] glucosamine N-acyltransferase
MRLDALARHVGGELAGDPALEVDAVVPPEEAKPGAVVVLTDPRRLREVEAAGGALILAADAPATSAPAIRVPQIRVALARALQALAPAPAPRAGIHPTCILGHDVRLGRDVYLGPYAVLGDGVALGDGAQVHAHTVLEDGVVVGPGCVLHPRVTVRRGCRLGARVVLRTGAVIGSEGFGYAQDRERRHLPIPQIGRVVLEDDVEIGALSTVDRAMLGATRIGRGTKIDNHVHVAHNAQIGEDCAIAAGVLIGGTARVGNRVLIGGLAGLRDHVDVGDDAAIHGDSAVAHNVRAGTIVAGRPAWHHVAQRRSEILIRRLPNLFKQVREFERRLRRLEER